MNKDFYKYAKKVLLFGSPVILLALLYFVCDPFHVLRYYEAYPDNFLKSYNRNRISTQVFLNNNEELHYESFVFGSSRSSVFYTKDWGEYIDDSSAYHFDASNEDIQGIAQKLAFIQSQGNEIKNALLILDGETFNPSVDHDESIIHIRDWRWSGESRFMYQLHFFKAWFKDLYFVKYFDILLFGKYRPYMYGSFENKHMLYTPVHNDFIFQGYIDRIKADSLAYYNADLFYQRPATEQTAEALIDMPQNAEDQTWLDTFSNLFQFGEPEKTELDWLKQIRRIFEQEGTDYVIIFGPNYDQKKVNPQDLEQVTQLFGADKVYDFTGKNDLTEPLSNYYEIYHYKPVVARAILKEIYTRE